MPPLAAGAGVRFDVPFAVGVAQCCRCWVSSASPGVSEVDASFPLNCACPVVGVVADATAGVANLPVESNRLTRV